MEPTDPELSHESMSRPSDFQESPRDRLLAELLTDLKDRASRGEAVDIDRATADHPDLADELRQLWGMAMLVDAAGSSAHNVSTGGLSVATPRESATPTNATLPRRFGDYELLSELGRGGMGIVYRARQISLNRIVAIKMLLRGGLASTEDQARFLHEAESLGGLDHPNIVPIYEVGQHDGQLFFSMKYVEGQTLSQMMATERLSARLIAELLVPVARAIHFAHENGILHRDVKPSNILIDEAGVPHITDFGLARRQTGTDSITRTGAVLGTPTYMAPEQAAGNRGELGPATDVYSLGAVLYHLLTGRPPFQAASSVDVVFMVLEQDPILPRALEPKVDRDLEMITLRCLQKPTDLRYESAGAFADDLQAFLNSEPISARSGKFSHVIARMFRETHHAAVLENWGLLWMWHSLVLLVICLSTNALYWLGDVNRMHYFLLWTAGLGTWAAVFWALRHRMGPVTFVERQIAHVWAASVISIALLFPLEYLMGLKVLALSPMLGLQSAMVFLIKGGILSGGFYIQAVLLFLSSFLIALLPNFGHLIFGLISAPCFFFPGWKYYRKSLAA